MPGVKLKEGEGMENVSIPSMPTNERIASAINKAYFIKGYIYEKHPNIVNNVNYIIDVLKSINLEEGDHTV